MRLKVPKIKKKNKIVEWTAPALNGRFYSLETWDAVLDPGFLTNLNKGLKHKEE